jgi:hypothetical protein
VEDEPDRQGDYRLHIARTSPPCARPEREPWAAPLPGREALDTAARDHARWVDATRVLAHYEVAGRLDIATDPAEQAARRWLADRDSVIVVHDQAHEERRARRGARGDSLAVTDAGLASLNVRSDCGAGRLRPGDAMAVELHGQLKMPTPRNGGAAPDGGTYTAIAIYDGQQWASLCPELDIASVGGSADEAIRNLIDAVQEAVRLAADENMEPGAPTPDDEVRRFMTSSLAPLQMLGFYV